MANKRTKERLAETMSLQRKDDDESRVCVRIPFNLVVRVDERKTRKGMI